VETKSIVGDFITTTDSRITDGIYASNIVFDIFVSGFRSRILCGWFFWASMMTPRQKPMK
jgi:hypothetical protein